ncbi:hypothetical protein ACU8DI_12550 [Psychroserpens sp. BH13MA-6]
MKFQNRSHTVFLVVLLLSFQVSIAQIKIVGNVKSANQIPIENASIVVSDSSNAILDYTYTNPEGLYAIELHTLNGNFFKLSAQSLGFDKKTATISIEKNTKTYTVSFELNEKVERLNEVLLRPTEKIARQGDTITYKVNAFKDGTEQTVEDILKRLPGIEVMEDGSIKAKGRLIDKLLVEGEDLFDKNYKVLSKNLDANTLDAVEILDAFEENPIIAKVIKSEKIALNLVLKDDYKNIWFGNASLGVGTEERLKLASNIGLIRKKIKFFNFNDYNNLGRLAKDQVEQVQSVNTGFFRQGKIETSISPIYNISDNNNTLFKNGESTFNKAFINSLGFVTSLSPKLKLRGTGYVTSDVEEQLFSSETVFNLGTDPIVFNEQNDFVRNTTLGGGEMELKYAKNSKTYIKNVLVYENRPERTRRHAIFNDQIISENLRQKEFSLANHLEHSYLIGDKTLLHSYLHFGQNNIKQDSDIDSPVLNDFLSQSNVSRIKHKASDEVTNFGGRSSLILNLGRLKTNLEIGYESINEARNNAFLITDQNVNTEVDSLSNAVNYKQQTVGFKGEFEYSLSKHIELSGRLKLDHVNLEFGRLHRKRWLFNPKIRLAFKNLNIGYLSLSFGQSFNVPKSHMFLESYQLRSFQSFVLGADDLLIPKRNRFALYYQIANDLQTKSLTVSAQYDDANGRYSTNNQIGNNITLTNYRFVESGQSFSSKIDFTNYFRKLNISTNLGIVQNISSIPINANNSGFQDLKTFRSSYFLTATTYFDFPVNLKFKTSFNYAKSNFNSVKAKRKWQTLDAKASYKLSKVWIASLNNNSYFIEKGTYTFTDLQLEITPMSSRFSYRVIVNNILNQDTYSVIDINGFSAYRSEIMLLPRYLFASIKYRF